MKITSRFASLFLAGSLLSAPAAMLAQGPPPPPGGYYGGGQGYNQGGYNQGGQGYNQGGWDAPPNSYRQDVQRAAFRDGIEGARKDAENRRRPNVNNRDEFRNYRGPNRHAYRQAFQAGYSAFWNHQGGGYRRPY